MWRSLSRSFLALRTTTRHASLTARAIDAMKTVTVRRCRRLLPVNHQPAHRATHRCRSVAFESHVVTKQVVVYDDRSLSDPSSTDSAASGRSSGGRRGAAPAMLGSPMQRGPRSSSRPLRRSHPLLGS